MAGKMWKLAVCACAMALCFALTACGGSSTSSNAAASSSGASASASASSSAAPAADPADKFVGNWKMAAAEMEGLTVTGDFSSGAFGTDISMSMDLAEDGTGTMTFGDESANLKWELAGDDAITLIPQNKESTIESLTAKYDDGVLAVDMQDDEYSGTLYLSADGTMDGVFAIDPSSAKAITSEGDLVGTWKLAGVNMMGMSMYGNADDLAAMMGDDASYTVMEIKADGAATLMGQSCTWKVDSAGATVTMDGVDIPLKSLNGDVVLDLSSITGDLGLDMIMLFSK